MCIRWYTWWLAYLSKAGKVWGQKEKSRCDRTLPWAVTGSWPCVRSVAHSEGRPRSFDQTLNSRSYQMCRACVRSGVMYTDICFVAEPERTWRRGASGRDWVDAFGHQKSSLEPFSMWPDVVLALGMSRPFTRCWHWRARVQSVHRHVWSQLTSRLIVT
jgi:hypothetical protein